MILVALNFTLAILPLIRPIGVVVKRVELDKDDGDSVFPS